MEERSIFEICDDFSNQGFLLFQKFNNSNIYNLSKSNKFKLRFKILLHFLTAIGFIKNGISDVFTSQNIPSMLILYRTLTEHNLKLKYLVYNDLKTQSDYNFQIFSDISKYKDLEEEINSKKRLNKLQKIDRPIDINNFEELKFDIKEKYDLQIKSNFNDFINQFSPFNIITFFSNEFSEENDVLEGIIDIWPLLSSYVHGSTHSYYHMMKIGQNNDIDIYSIMILINSNTIYLNSLELFFQLFSFYDDNHLDFYSKIQNINKNFKEFLDEK